MQRTTCASFLELLRGIAPLFEELARHDAIGADLINGKLAMRFSPDRLSPAAKRWAAESDLTTRDLVKHWLQTRVVVEGPKIFQPTLDQCLALEQVAPRLTIRDYAQPYPVMIVELPEEYQRLRVCSFVSQAPVADHAPACVVIGTYGRPAWTVWLDLMWDSGVGLQWALLPTDPTIEDGIVREFGADSYVVTPFTGEQRLIVAGLLRLAVNAMLLLADFGCKRLGPANEAHYRRLEHYAALARKRGKGVAEAQRNLRLAAQLYGFPQDVVLYGEERTSPPAAGGAGDDESHRRPHWRRGHWKMQACGPGLNEHKRLYIKPVLVNRQLLRDGERIPRTTYRFPRSS